LSAPAAEGDASLARRVVVIGAGIAGTAAVITAARAGARVTVLDGGTGASMLATGALDFAPWHTRLTAHDEVIDADVRATLEALGGYLVPQGGATLVTTAGVVRHARGHDSALLDVAALVDPCVAVVRCARAGWDADALARAWGPSYCAVDASVLRYSDEEVLPDAELASRHDDDARLVWLAERLRRDLAAAGGSYNAIVLPPMLGVERARAEDLSSLTGVGCGEAVALPGGPAGLRFERARDRAFRACGATHARLRARGLQIRRTMWCVETEGGASFEGHAVVLATGGLVGGGLEYAPSEATLATTLPARARPPLRITIDAPVWMGVNGRPLELPGSLFGATPESIASPFAQSAMMDRAGILTGIDGAARGVSAIFAAGEVVADAARGWLTALAGGVRAGAAAAGLMATSARRSLAAGPAIRP
jgi:alanine dehydrogenase/PNT-like protein